MEEELHRVENQYNANAKESHNLMEEVCLVSRLTESWLGLALIAIIVSAQFELLRNQQEASELSAMGLTVKADDRNVTQRKLNFDGTPNGQVTGRHSSSQTPATPQLEMQRQRKPIDLSLEVRFLFALTSLHGCFLEEGKLNAG